MHTHTHTHTKNPSLLVLHLSVPDSVRPPPGLVIQAGLQRHPGHKLTLSPSFFFTTHNNNKANNSKVVHAGSDVMYIRRHKSKHDFTWLQCVWNEFVKTVCHDANWGLKASVKGRKWSTTEESPVLEDNLLIRKKTLRVGAGIPLYATGLLIAFKEKSGGYRVGKQSKSQCN